MENLERLVNELRKIPNEIPWVEFKHNNYNPEMIGQDVSALANSAALHEKSCAYMLWALMTRPMKSREQTTTCKH